MDDAPENIISKKIASARKVNTPIPRLNNVLMEFTKTIEKKARDYLGGVVEAMILDVETKMFSDVLDAISMPAMIALVDVDGVERAALINMDLDLVYHVVDLRMGGLPGELPEFGARRPTSIDCSMCGPLVDIMLEGLSHALSETTGAAELADMNFGAFEHLPMLANIVPEKADVLCVRISLDIGEAARSGNFELVLPFSTIDLIQAKLKKSTSITADAARDVWASHMLGAVLDTEIDLLPVLHSAHYSVAEMSRLEVGQVLPLEMGAHRGVDLVIDFGDEVQAVASARLGAFKGVKALKLLKDPDQSFLSPLARLAARSAPA